MNKVAKFVIDTILKNNEAWQKKEPLNNTVRSRFICRFVPILFMSKASSNLPEFQRLLQPQMTKFVANLRAEAR